MQADVTHNLQINNWHFRSSRPEVFYKKVVLRNLAKFIEKHLYQSLFFNKVADLRLFLQNTFGGCFWHTDNNLKIFWLAICRLPSHRFANSRLMWMYELPPKLSNGWRLRSVKENHWNVLNWWWLRSRPVKMRISKIKNVFFIERETSVTMRLRIRLLIHLQLTTERDNLTQLCGWRKNYIITGTFYEHEHSITQCKCYLRNLLQFSVWNIDAKLFPSKK